MGIFTHDYDLAGHGTLFAWSALIAGITGITGIVGMIDMEVHARHSGALFLDRTWQRA